MPSAVLTLAAGAKKPPTARELLLAPIQVLDSDGTHTLSGALYIKNGRIHDRGLATKLKARYRDSKVIAAPDFVAMPGLTNAHTHAAMGFFRDLGHAAPTPGAGESIIESFLFPAEKSLTAKLTKPLSYSYLLNGLRSGVTCFADHYYFIEGVGRALEQLGMRGMIGETIADLGGAFPGVDGWHRARRTIENWPFDARRILPVVAPHAADTVSEPLLRELAAYAEQHHLPLHMHLSQTTGERQRVQQRTGLSPVAYAAKCGALTDRTLAVHLVTADKADIALLKKHGSYAGFCASSQVIYERLAPIKELCAAGVPITLGTDCAASNDSADMLTEMKIATLLSKDRGCQVDARSALQWTTTNCHQLFGDRQQPAGLAIGAAADIVFMRPDLGTQPVQDLATNLIFSCGAQQVKHVMIDGRWVLWQQQPTLISESDMQNEYLAAVAAIKKRLGKK